VTRPRSAVAAVLAVVLLGAGTAGCGGSAEDRYCSALQSDRSEFAAMIGDGSPTALVTHLAMLERLAGKAPDDLSDEWQAFLNPIRGLRDALDRAGVKPSDYSAGKPPAGLAAADVRAITEAADKLSAAGTVEAAGGIDQQARDVCKINLGI
jgi:ABC-type glycerol-3-phosphate transport system substrate-binding protein